MGPGAPTPLTIYVTECGSIVQFRLKLIEAHSEASLFPRSLFGVPEVKYIQISKIILKLISALRKDLELCSVVAFVYRILIIVPSLKNMDIDINLMYYFIIIMSF